MLTGKGLIVFLTLFASLTIFASPQTSSIRRYGSAYRYNKNGWIYLHIEGKPYQRGFQHGFLMAKELKKVFHDVRYLTYFNYGKSWQFFVNAATKLFVPYMDKEYLQEIKGIAAGARKAGTQITWQEILTWNGYYELTGGWWPNAKSNVYKKTKKLSRCSAFIATGSATKDGKIVMAHNMVDDYTLGQFANMILDIKPSHGHRIVMQSEPGYIDSNTDFFMNDAGLMGLETSITGFKPFSTKGMPEFERQRKATQYANNIHQWIRIMSSKNNGGNAADWLIGDIKTNEIARLELGLKYHRVW